MARPHHTTRVISLLRITFILMLSPPLFDPASSNAADLHHVLDEADEAGWEAFELLHAIGEVRKSIRGCMHGRMRTRVRLGAHACLLCESLTSA